MNTKRFVLFGFALISAATAGYVALNIKPETVAVTEKPVVVESEQVLVASETIAVGDVLDAQLTWQTWPNSGVSEGFITRMVIFKGEPVRDAKLVGKDQSLMSSILPTGRRAVAVEIAANTSAGGFILPNDYVDLIMTRQKAGNNGTAERFVTDTIVKNVRVLAIDQTIKEDEEGRKVRVGQTATLELTPQQAEIVVVAQQMAARLTLSLRSTADVTEAVKPDADYLLNGEGTSIKVIKSGQISEVGSK
jgi:pilus assembly protein CpaB